jgi:hypothetical protein
MNAGSGSTVRRLLTVGFAGVAALGAARLAAFAEEGKAPQIPARLIRVPEGTVIAASMRSALADASANPGEQK